jgi:hypothetical protein
MSAGDANGSRPERRDLGDAIAGRRRAQLVSGLRALRSAGGSPGASAAEPVGDTAEAAAMRAQGVSLVGVTTGPSSEAGAFERCDLCGVGIGEDHRHLLELSQRRIVCACEACWAMRAGEGDYRPTGSRTLWLPDLDIPDELWASFQIPIGLAFLMHSTVTGCVVAMYPSPAGATESELHFSSWQEMVARNPILDGLEPDIEGLIVNRLVEPHVHAIAPIDACYGLTGAIKASWEGISGGSGVERAVSRFFEALRERAVGA